MNSDKIHIYPSLGKGFSMERYLNGVCQGCVDNKFEFQIIKPSRNGFLGKYIIYPLLVWKNRQRPGKHLIISERYSYLLFFLKRDKIIVCHDLHTLSPQARTPLIHRLLYEFFLNSMTRADKLVCVSDQTKNDLLQYSSKFRDSNKLEVIHNGIEEFWVSDQNLLEESSTWVDIFNSKKVLLSVGTDAWYKNNRWSLELLKKLDSEFHLLRIGEFSTENERYIERSGLGARITKVSNVSDQHLKMAYQRACYFLFPSVSEGFGWPSLEAALCGCSVITNRLKVTYEIFPNDEGLIFLEEAEDCIASNVKRVATPRYTLWVDQVKILIA